jgi:hypothetical protein
MILRHCGKFLKVLHIHSYGNEKYRFECHDLSTKEEKVFRFNMSGLLEAADYAFKVMKSSKDIFFLDLDQKGKWIVVNRGR